MNVLFPCTGNSCLSVLSEGVFNHPAPAGWRALSTSSHTVSALHSRALALLARKEITYVGYYIKT